MASAWGETTPGYLYKAWARKRMCRDLPEARFLVILRDPVERAYSHYWMNRSQGLEEESFEEALRLEEPRRETLSRQKAANSGLLLQSSSTSAPTRAPAPARATSTRKAPTT